MTNYQKTAAWLKACGIKENDPAELSCQAGGHLEEVCELLSCLRIDSDSWQRLLERCVEDLNDLADKLKSGQKTAHFPPHLRTAVLDALCDEEVTLNAIAYAAGFDKDGADAEVIRSNDAKLVDGKAVILPGGKIGKPAGWQPPNLKPFLRRTAL